MARHFKRSGNDKKSKTRLAALIMCAVLLVCFIAAPEIDQIQDILNANGIKDKIMGIFPPSDTEIIAKDSELITKKIEEHKTAAKSKDSESVHGAISNDTSAKNKKTPAGTYASSDIPKASETTKYKGRPMLAIIIDDGGANIDLAKKVAGYGIPSTWAIMPYQSYTLQTAELAESKGIPYLLHLPMQAEIDKQGGPFLIGKGMDRETIASVTKKALDTLPSPIGINNHRGSLATADWDIMVPIIDVLREKNMIFVDSSTSGKSVAYEVAKAAGIGTLKNRGFLDHTADKDAIEARFHETIKMASKRGDLVVICHFRPATVLFLSKLSKTRHNLPVDLVTVPEMLRRLNITDNQDED